MNTRLQWGGLALFALAFTACAPVDDAADDDVEARDDALFASTGNLWENKRIEVCWEWDVMPFTYERGVIQGALEGTWAAVSSVDFTGFGQCAANARGLRIGNGAEWPHTKGLGNQLDGVTGVRGRLLPRSLQRRRAPDDRERQAPHVHEPRRADRRRLGLRRRPARRPRRSGQQPLYLKVSENSPPCGSRMPMGAALPAGEIALIHDWIAAGALE